MNSDRKDSDNIYGAHRVEKYKSFFGDKFILLYERIFLKLTYLSCVLTLAHISTNISDIWKMKGPSDRTSVVVLNINSIFNIFLKAIVY